MITGILGGIMGPITEEAAVIADCHEIRQGCDNGEGHRHSDD
jgi:hypothetical protein